MTVSSEYKLQLNSTFYYANFSSDTRLNSTVLNITLYLNNTYYQTPESATFILGNINQFTSHFSFSNGQGVEPLTFTESSLELTDDHLKIPIRIIYLKEATPREYETVMVVIVKAREAAGLIPYQDVQRSAVRFTVTKS